MNGPERPKTVSCGVILMVLLTILFGSMGACSFSYAANFDSRTSGAPLDLVATLIGVIASVIALVCIVWIIWRLKG